MADTYVSSGRLVVQKIQPPGRRLAISILRGPVIGFSGKVGNNKAGFQDPHPENRLWQKQEGNLDKAMIGPKQSFGFSFCFIINKNNML